MQRFERRLMQKEEVLERKQNVLEKREEGIQQTERRIEDKENAIEKLYEDQVKELERLSGLTTEEARQLILSRLESELTYETAHMIKEMEFQAREEADKRARNILSLAIQRLLLTM